MSFVKHFFGFDPIRFYRSAMYYLLRLERINRDLDVYFDSPIINRLEENKEIVNLLYRKRDLIQRLCTDLRLIIRALLQKRVRINIFAANKKNDVLVTVHRMLKLLDELESVICDQVVYYINDHDDDSDIFERESVILQNIYVISQELSVLLDFSDDVAKKYLLECVQPRLVRAHSLTKILTSLAFIGASAYLGSQHGTNAMPSIKSLYELQSSLKI